MFNIFEPIIRERKIVIRFPLRGINIYLFRLLKISSKNHPVSHKNQGILPEGQSGMASKLNTHIHTVQCSWMHAITLTVFPKFPWRCAELCRILYFIILYDMCTWYSVIKNKRSVTLWNSLRDLPFPVAARSKAWICGCSLEGILVSNPVGGMDVFLLSAVCFLVDVTASDRSAIRRSPTECGGSSECDRETP
jgi:hypothetical protein